MWISMRIRIRKVVILELFNCCWSIIIVIFAIALELIDLSLSHTHFKLVKYLQSRFGAFLLEIRHFNGNNWFYRVIQDRQMQRTKIDYSHRWERRNCKIANKLNDNVCQCLLAYTYTMRLCIYVCAFWMISYENGAV